MCSALAAGCMIAGAGAHALPIVEDGIEILESVPQGQVFYAPRVSRIATPDGQACMVSAGTDWKNTAEARQAGEFVRALLTLQSRNAAFAHAAEVPVADLASNTPYLMALFTEDGLQTLRIAAGFALNPRTLELRAAGESARVTARFEIEERGDTARLADPQEAEAFVAALGAGSDLKFSARSKKNGDPDQEHFLRYHFTGGFDAEALADCRRDLAAGAPLLATPTPTVSFIPLADQDGPEWASLRGAACNRDLDLDNAEVMALDGPITGFTTPLSHALVKRDDAGQIIHIVSGDLWRISRTRDGYDMAISRSITAQSPMMPQLEKACTRYDTARCANLTVDPETGKVAVAECLGVFMAERVTEPGLGLVAPAFPPLVMATPIGGTGGGGSDTPSVVQPGPGGGDGPSTTPLPPISFPDVPQKPTDEIVIPNPPDPNEVTNVPVPAGIWLLLAAAAVLAGLGHRRA